MLTKSKAHRDHMKHMFVTLLSKASADIETLSSSMKAFFTVLRFMHEIIFIHLEEQSDHL